MKHVAVFSLSLAIVLLLGCKKDSPTVPPIPQPQIMPLAVGNQWAREFTLYDTTGVPFASGMDTIRVLSDTLLNGQQCFIVFLQGTTHVLANRSDGLSWWLNPGWGIHYKYPASEQDSFFYIGGYNISRVVSTDTVLAVPAGVYSCYHYSTSINPNYTIRGRLEEDIAPNLGFVQGEYFQSVSATSPLYLYSRIKLKSFILN